ncbi:hypothetical protein P3T76_001311 [Phytophthora citrophthora]|uniref:Uncharacterized protein n=1 Tax=Phytophthora citrophthora TaxID=4793 RepID=A0AAD9LSR8_9STRA|nr:hypothetical protein P3T76_001311 [Phytophthora citrophthora]
MDSPAEQKYSKWSTRNVVQHGLLRDAGKAFTTVKSHEGVPFVPWKDLSDKMHVGIRGLPKVVRIHFHGERLVVNRNGGTHLTTDPITRTSGTTYLRFEYAILDSRILQFVAHLISDWYNNLFGKLAEEHEKKEKENKEKENKKEEKVEVKFNGTPVEGFCTRLHHLKLLGCTC